MKLSYIIPVFNIKEYLPQCIESVLSQSLDDCEIILIDDGSTDGSGLICDEYSARFSNIISLHIKNSGPSVARNAGLKISKGEYVWFIDGDDYITGDFSNELYTFATENNLDILRFSYKLSNDEEPVNLVFEDRKIYSREELKPFLYHSNTDRLLIYAWRNIYKRDFLLNNNIKFSEDLKMIEDPPFNMECLSKCNRFCAIKKTVYCYRIRNNSLQRTKFVKDYDLTVLKQCELKNKFFNDAFGKSKEYDCDSAEFTVKVLLPLMLKNIYNGENNNKIYELKRIRKSKMIKKSFEDYNIELFKSRSLDWVATKLLKLNLFFPVHLICKYILYKK